MKGPQVHREIPSEFYKQLASVPMASAPEYVIALVKASLSAPEKYIVNQKARLFTTQDLVRLTKDKRLEVQKAHAVMRQARVLLSSADVGEAQVSQCLGTLDVRLVMFVHEKGGWAARVRIHFAHRRCFLGGTSRGCARGCRKVRLPMAPR